ncbi:MAG TPA: translation initiation factor [Myxococcales bacterium]|nr:translation initiation factor [Myxococcales bacterium]
MADKPFNNPFAVLAGKAEGLPEGPKPVEPPPPKGPARAVVRMERKGRGGKEVTVIEQLELRPRELESWLKELKNRLGCGGVVEAGALVLQGDLRERVKPLLAAKGVRKISVG